MWNSRPRLFFEVAGEGACSKFGGGFSRLKSRDGAAGDAGARCRVRAWKAEGRSRVVSGRHPGGAPSEGDPTRGVRRSFHGRA